MGIGAVLLGDAIDLLENVQLHGLILEILDFVSDHDFQVPEFPLGVLYFIELDHALADHVPRLADEQLHLAPDGREPAPVLAEECLSSPAVLDEYPNLSRFQREKPQARLSSVLDPVVHQDAGGERLVLVQGPVGVPVESVGLSYGCLVETVQEHLDVFLLTDGLGVLQLRTESGPHACGAEVLAGVVSNLDEFPQQHVRFLSVDHGLVVESARQVADQVAHPDSSGATFCSVDLPNQGVFPGRVGDIDDIDLLPAVDTPYGAKAVPFGDPDGSEDDRVLVDAGVRPAEIDHVVPCFGGGFDQGDDPLLLDERVVPVVEPNFHAFPLWKRGELDAAHCRGRDDEPCRNGDPYRGVPFHGFLLSSLISSVLYFR
ncbi:MAG: hypothetical protein ACYTFG_04675 [Planctomycetota bacterium]